jgi:hypothetical protein
MTETKFTPGPWSVDNDHHVYTNLGAANTYNEYCENFRWEIADCMVEMIQPNGTTIRLPMSESKANAYLIAQSPRMYAAIEKAEDMLRRIGVDTQDPEDSNEILAMAYSLLLLLAEARGES